MASQRPASPTLQLGNLEEWPPLFRRSPNKRTVEVATPTSRAAAEISTNVTSGPHSSTTTMTATTVGSGPTAADVEEAMQIADQQAGISSGDVWSDTQAVTSSPQALAITGSPHSPPRSTSPLALTAYEPQSPLTERMVSQFPTTAMAHYSTPKTVRPGHFPLGARFTPGSSVALFEDHISEFWGNPDGTFSTSKEVTLASLLIIEFRTAMDYFNRFPLRHQLLTPPHFSNAERVESINLIVEISERLSLDDAVLDLAIALLDVAAHDWIPAGDEKLRMHYTIACLVLAVNMKAAVGRSVTPERMMAAVNLRFDRRTYDFVLQKLEISGAVRYPEPVTTKRYLFQFIRRFEDIIQCDLGRVYMDALYNLAFRVCINASYEPEFLRFASHLRAIACFRFCMLYFNLKLRFFPQELDDGNDNTNACFDVLLAMYNKNNLV